MSLRLLVSLSLFLFLLFSASAQAAPPPSASLRLELRKNCSSTKLCGYYLRINGCRGGASKLRVVTYMMDANYLTREVRCGYYALFLGHAARDYGFAGALVTPYKISKGKKVLGASRQFDR